jgi:TRAP-type uncharacterized transport system substrate-binding protein
MRILQFTLITLILVSMGGCDTGPQTLRIATPTLSVDQKIAEDLTELFGDTDQIHLEMAPGSLTESEAMDALATGTVDVALVSNAMPFHSDVATVIPLYPTVLHIAYRAGRDASSGSALLHDARVFADAEGTASRRIFDRIASGLDITESDFEFINDVETMADIVVLFTPISPQRVAAYPEMRLFSFGAPEDIGNGNVVDAATLLNPYLRPFVIPARTYGDITPQPVLTVAVDKYLVARRDLDPSLVYDLINELLRLRPALSARHPGLFEHLSDNFDVSRSTFVLHPGTQAYLQREAPTIYERYSGVAEAMVTLIIALFSAALAGVRILQRRRKNRIDRFYSAAIEIRDSISAKSSSDDRSVAIQKTRDLQNDAFDQLVHEKLAADESFRIFITLSNDVLRQLRSDA